MTVDQLREQGGGFFGVAGLLRLVHLPPERSRTGAAIGGTLLGQRQHEHGGLGPVESQA